MDSVKTPLQLQPPTYGNFVSVLSIDGGGIRGLIPGIILGFLESELQKLDGKEARIADYFDVIAGTSTGGLVTSMLTCPNEENRPLYAADDIKDFYLTHTPKIFPQKHNSLFKIATKLLGALSGPKYDGKYLHSLLKEQLGCKKLHQTLTNVVIPTFDIQRLQPTIFSSYEAKRSPSLDALLSDVCISTSAAPTYLPPHYFETTDPSGNVRKFNLVDGGVAANNPTLVAMSEVTKEIIKGNKNFFPINPMDYAKFLVISLGTGSPKWEEKFNSRDAAEWGLLGWLDKQGSTPLIDVFTQSSADMVDIHISALFTALNCQENYLRIQDDTLRGDESSTDIATEENLEKLVRIGEALLNKPVARVNLDTGIFEAIHNDTNADALRRFAKLLSDEKQYRLMRSPDGHKA